MSPLSIPTPLPSAGFPVPVEEIHASFALFGFLPFGSSRNSINPRLVLHPTQIEVKVLQTDFYKHEQLSEVDYLPSWLLRSSQVLLKLQQGTTFYVYLATAAREQEFINYLRALGIPLSEAAQRVVG